MTLSSMTGFARLEGNWKEYHWAWEIRSVNGKGLDIRMRLPQVGDSIEATLRKKISAVLRRGNISLNLQFHKDQSDLQLVVNETVLKQYLSIVDKLQQLLPDAPSPTIDSILAQKGILEAQETETEEAKQQLQQQLLISFDMLLVELQAMRKSEGEAIHKLLTDQLGKISDLTATAEALPSRQPEAIKAKLVKLLDDIMNASAGKLDEQRLYQEVAILATKADIQEELDRLKAHVEACQQLLDKDGSVGRRMDFLAQEFNREANTLCSKSNSVELTAIGLELKTVIDQLREQTQNVE
ncbi:YicC/YloC family endoribonuclease [Polycladidibacter stylochi]|uniref:YicC/YloC family endoribonuclease n=1 Tax=Polycladidibacter stylochi TaxID=1807766 RepID=UPI000832A605|nr:YicC/YloC family endoribonuclease [Pseudovibrio stylochi]